MVQWLECWVGGGIGDTRKPEYWKSASGIKVSGGNEGSGGEIGIRWKCLRTKKTKVQLAFGGR